MDLEDLELAETFLLSSLSKTTTTKRVSGTKVIKIFQQKYLLTTAILYLRTKNIY